MALKKYSLESSPSPRDKNRYMLNLVSSEKDVKDIAEQLGNIASRPTPSADSDYDWSLFLNNANDGLIEKLKTELDKAVKRNSESKTETSEEEKQNREVKAANKTVDVNSLRLNPDYIFDNFVVGTSIRFTYAACKSVSESPGKNYNPLFIYGGVGLGKTHLMHAIGNHVQKKFPDFSIVYLTTDEFVRDVIDSIEKGTVKDLRERFKQVDLLLIDDIQFLERSESTQEEFFHIFNLMYEVQKQIVITSDKPPKKLATLEDRLKSRFEWGLTTDIKTPNFETRKAIIKKKSEKLKLNLPEEVSNYIAERLTSNIRELEGIINRVYAHQQLSQEKVTLDYIKEIFENLLPEEDLKNETVEGITLKNNGAGVHGDKNIKKNNEISPSLPPNTPMAPSIPPPSYQNPYVQQQQVVSACARCGRPLTFIPQYQKWYCTSCGLYMEPLPSFPPQYQQPPGFGVQPPPNMPALGIEKKCNKCNAPLMYVQEYDRYYCSNCREYEPEQKIPAPPQSGVATEQKFEPKSESKKLKVNSESEQEKKKTAPVEAADTLQITESQAESADSEKNFEEVVIGEEQENVREIKAGYFLPEKSDEFFADIVDKLGKLSKQKKFNFYIRPMFAHYYSPDVSINYEKIVYMAKTNEIDIALCLEPKHSNVKSEEFRNELSEVMDKENMPFEILPQREIKESDALNFMLDIAICARKGMNK
jgi:chromosomal replication initiator protein